MEYYTYVYRYLEHVYFTQGTIGTFEWHHKNDFVN